MRAGCPSVAAAVADSSLLPKCTRLALERPNCSALQCAVLRSMQSALLMTCGTVTDLWRPLLLAGDLPKRLSEIIEAAAPLPIGKRPSNVGFAVAMADTLATAASGATLVPPLVTATSGDLDADDKEQPTVASPDENAPPAAPLAPWQTELGKELDAVGEWSGLVAPGGALEQLLKAQRSELGGPRPSRPGPPGDMDAELAALGGGGQMISGQELLALLRGLSMGAPGRG